MTAILWGSWCSLLTRLLQSSSPLQLLGYLVGHSLVQQPDPSRALESQRYLLGVWYRTIVGVGDCHISRFYELWLCPCSEDLDYHSGLTGEPDRARRRTRQLLGHAIVILKSRKEKMIESGNEEKKHSVQGQENNW